MDNFNNISFENAVSLLAIADKKNTNFIIKLLVGVIIAQSLLMGYGIYRFFNREAYLEQVTQSDPNEVHNKVDNTGDGDVNKTINAEVGK